MRGRSEAKRIAFWGDDGSIALFVVDVGELHFADAFGQHEVTQQEVLAAIDNPHNFRFVEHAASTNSVYVGY